VVKQVAKETVKEELKELKPVEDSDYVKAWKLIPKEKREKLTKK
jgi:hypothetical protein